MQDHSGRMVQDERVRAQRKSAARSTRIAILTFAAVEAIFIGAAILTSLLR
jgi:hypothetical protein